MQHTNSDNNNDLCSKKEYNEICTFMEIIHYLDIDDEIINENNFTSNNKLKNKKNNFIKNGDGLLKSLSNYFKEKQIKYQWIKENNKSINNDSIKKFKNIKPDDYIIFFLPNGINDFKDYIEINDLELNIFLEVRQNNNLYSIEYFGDYSNNNNENSPQNDNDNGEDGDNQHYGNDNDGEGTYNNQNGGFEEDKTVLIIYKVSEIEENENNINNSKINQKEKEKKKKEKSNNKNEGKEKKSKNRITKTSDVKYSALNTFTIDNQFTKTSKKDKKNKKNKSSKDSKNLSLNIESKNQISKSNNKQTIKNESNIKKQNKKEKKKLTIREKELYFVGLLEYLVVNNFKDMHTFIIPNYSGDQKKINSFKYHISKSYHDKKSKVYLKKILYNVFLKVFSDFKKDNAKEKAKWTLELFMNIHLKKSIKNSPNEIEFKNNFVQYISKRSFRNNFFKKCIEVFVKEIVDEEKKEKHKPKKHKNPQQPKPKNTNQKQQLKINIKNELNLSE